MSKRPRIVTGAFGHETNGISKLPTGMPEFQSYLLATGNNIPALLGETSHEIAGVMQAAHEYDWELIFTVAGFASPSGAVTHDAWDLFVKEILSGCDGSTDGVLLALHGAMATTEFLDGEGELLRLVRGIVGDNVPIAVTLDLHANVTSKMCQYADIISTFRTYPHIDQVETARRAAKILNHAITSGKRPRTLIAKRNISTGLDDGRTTTENPMTKALRRVEKIESTQPDIALLGLHAGFNLGALPGAGPSVTVTYWDDRDQASQIAENLMDYVEETHKFDSNSYLSVDQAIEQALRALTHGGTGPVVLADYSDNPGAGAYSDATGLLRGMIDADVQNAALGAMCDPEVANQLTTAGLGAVVTVTLGGKIDPTLSDPLTLTGTVTGISNGNFIALGPYHQGTTQSLGKTAVLKVGGIEIVIGSTLLQCTDLELFSHLGIDPTIKDLVAVKSMHHFRAAFAPIARQVLVVDSGGMVGLLAAPHYERMRANQSG